MQPKCSQTRKSTASTVYLTLAVEIMKRKNPAIWRGFFVGQNGYAILTSIVTPDGSERFVRASMIFGVGSMMSINASVDAHLKLLARIFVDER
jgi:hypothetical protein